ncbi:MAG: cyclic nucleotide-binding domain-containing protein [Pyrinomonadaceae bacterium]
MSFWDHVQTAAGIAGGFYWLVLCFVVLATVLFIYLPAERERIRNALLLFALSFAALLAAATLLSFGMGKGTTAYDWVRGAALFVESVAVINLVSLLVFEVALDAVRLKPPRIMRDLLSAFAYIVVAISLLSLSNVDLTGIVATSAVITAIIGFSLADTLGNVMGGMALQMERSIGVGDWVRIEAVEGQVKEISWRQTSIETRDWDTVVFPNSMLMRGQVTLLGRRLGEPRQQRRWIYFNVDFRFSPAMVIDTVETALHGEIIEHVAQQPAPHCLLLDFKDSYATYVVRYWLTNFALPDPTDSTVRARIYYALRRENISLSIPAQAHFISKENRSRRERKQQQEVEHRVEKLQHVELFNTLTEEESREMAVRLQVAPFMRGETITRQGAQSQWFYLITRGEAEVRVAVDGVSERVSLLHEGNFFGEMGMMTGEPRRATVIALTDVECYRLDRDSFQRVLRRRPEIAEDISHILARRRVELEALRGELTEEAMRLQMHDTQGALLSRIRNFFKLNDD